MTVRPQIVPEICAILPCLNEERAVRWIAERAPEEVALVLVDNGSTDRSAAIAEDAGFSVTFERSRHGAGTAISRGIRMSRSQIVCVLDCDGTVDPNDLLVLVAPLRDGSADFAVGKRVPTGKAMTLFHRVASLARTTLVRALFREWHLSDVGSARAYRRDAFPDDQFTSLNGRYGWTLDATLSAISTVGSDRVCEVSLPYRKRIGKSKISGTPVGAILATADSIMVIKQHRRANRGSAF